MSIGVEMQRVSKADVSIVIAAYNAEETIGRCLDSLLDLEYPAREILVVDNNSSDRTAEIVKSYASKGPVRYVFERKRGWPAARNTGIMHAKYPYVANIDADCVASPEWLGTLVAACKGERVGCVVGKTLVEPGETLAQRYYALSDPFCLEHKIGTAEFIPWGGGNNLLRREVFLQAGGYDAERFVSGADAEFHHRLARQFGYETKYEPAAIIYHRARGSVGEFFTVAAKYAHDGFLRSREGDMQTTRSYYRFFLIKRLGDIGAHIAGLVVRGWKASTGRGPWFDVAWNWFSIVCLSGTIAGYCKGRSKYLWRLWKSWRSSG
jgi:glycosyltransferase involved in cell wall biosynthesis